MPDEPKALAQRIRSMEDEDLVAVLEHTNQYTPEALSLAEQEVERRGGVAHTSRAVNVNLSCGTG